MTRISIEIECFLHNVRCCELVIFPMPKWCVGFALVLLML